MARDLASGRALALSSLWGPVAGLLFALLLTASGCERSGKTGDQPPIQEVAWQPQGETLYASVALTRQFLDDHLARVKLGETLLATYRVHLVPRDAWWPVIGAHESLLKRRVRLNLITLQYELQDVMSKDSTHTTEEEEAGRFLGRPRFIPVAPLNTLVSRSNYLLTVRFRLEQEGISRTLRALQRILRFWDPVEYVQQQSFVYSGSSNPEVLP